VSQRNSEYARIAGDTYVTPRWVYEALYTVEPWARDAWDCAPVGSDFDYLSLPLAPGGRNIATNPPFSLAERFCRRAKSTTRLVAMLLPHAFDTAKGRVDLWRGSFKAKYTLTKRIRWENLEQKKNGPSTNHSWYVWDYTYNGKPFMGWLP
jgi:hypothetical protein